VTASSDDWATAPLVALDLADGSQPHRALWDTIAAALLLPALITKAWPTGASLTDLLAIAAIDLQPPSPARAEQPDGQGSLFDAPG
jgi:hypothetical protein